MWFLMLEVLEQIRSLQKQGFTPSADQVAVFEASYGPSARLAGDTPRLLSVAGDTAEISVRGAITNRPRFIAYILTGAVTTYSEIISAVAAAEADDSIKNIVLAIDSPGGEFAGLFDALEAIRATTKPVKAVASNTCASAAFAIACEADEFVATNIATRVGSVGVAASFYVDENEVEITSSNAPNKRPDVTTEEGKAMVVEELDGLEDIFIQAIAKGRGVSAENVVKNFGKGATLLAQAALDRGMIDAIQSIDPSASDDATKTNTRTTVMNLEELKAQHPDTYQAAVKEGVDQERDRVGAHLTMGEAYGALPVAVKAVKEGTPMTQTLTAEYLAAGANAQAIDDAQGDSDDADAGDGAAAGGDDVDMGDEVAALVEAQLGITAEA